jgi:transcriptional regulator with XRE-family HTH domain
MTISELRQSLGLSQEAFARVVGLTSKSYVSELESGKETRCSVKVALEIERLSEGRISAASLNPDVGLVRDAQPPNEAAA